MKTRWNLATTHGRVCATGRPSLIDPVCRPALAATKVRGARFNMSNRIRL
ncbi:MAG: hypothetical protein RLZZ524_93, partial [Pseudomonadota bacterium]